MQKSPIDVITSKNYKKNRAINSEDIQRISEEEVGKRRFNVE